jgi:hypothetical protein
MKLCASQHQPSHLEVDAAMESPRPRPGVFKRPHVWIRCSGCLDLDGGLVRHLPFIPATPGHALSFGDGGHSRRSRLRRSWLLAESAVLVHQHVDICAHVGM